MHKILFVTSEAYPLIKTGGLGDVSGSLPRELHNAGHDIRLLLPAYRDVLKKVKTYRCIAETRHYGSDIRILETTLPGTRVKTWLVDSPAEFDRSGSPYHDEQGEPWSDNARRFALLAQTAVQLALDQLELSWRADIVHCNDWPSALVPALLSLFPQRPATLFTIHNLAYQGVFDSQEFIDLGLPTQLWGMNGLEFHRQFSFIKGGLVFSDAINTVSPGYANEVQREEFGNGLDGLLRHRKDDLFGIINGIDVKTLNPGTDEHLVQNYNRHTLTKKTENKRYLQKKMRLREDDEALLIGMVSRLVVQKGLDNILASMEKILSLPVQLVILGSGEKRYENSLKQYAKRHPGKMKVTIGYDEDLAHQIEAGADIYLMPSLFEPCGLNQIYSLRYGTLPLVSEVGGLADTVVDTDEHSLSDKTANGFVLADNNPDELVATLERAIGYYRDKASWKRLQHNAMTPDRSWKTSTAQYLRLYERIIKKAAEKNSSGD